MVKHYFIKYLKNVSHYSKNHSTTIDVLSSNVLITIQIRHNFLSYVYSNKVTRISMLSLNPLSPNSHVLIPAAGCYGQTISCDRQ